MKYLIFLLSFIFILSLGMGQLYAAEILFQAFSGDAPIPNADVEDPDKWNKNNVTAGKNLFQVADDRLKQTLNDCANTTKTLLPAVDGTGWSSYTIAVDIWWNDDDAVSIIFRFTDDNSYYSFTIYGKGDTPDNHWFLANGGAREEICDKEPNGILDEGDMPIDVNKNIPYTAVVRAIGPKIEAFFGEQMPRADILAGETPPKLAEATDNSHPRGAVGIHTSSCPAQFANILVIREDASVDASGKSAITWGQIKLAY